MIMNVVEVREGDEAESRSLDQEAAFSAEGGPVAGGSKQRESRDVVASYVNSQANRIVGCTRVLIL